MQSASGAHAPCRGKAHYYAQQAQSSTDWVLDVCVDSFEELAAADQNERSLCVVTDHTHATYV